MQNDHAVAPWDEARLKREHPFYGAVTGQALFYLLQEYELTDARVQELLDEFEAGKQTLLDLINARPAAIRLQAEGEACQACAALDGLVIPLANAADDACAHWITLLPPYGLGCRLKAVAAEAPAGGCVIPPAVPRLQPLCSMRSFDE